MNETEQVQSITSISGYYNQISALDLKEGQTATVQVAEPSTSANILFSPFLIHVMVVVFFLLFLGGIGLLLYQRVVDRKRILTVMSVAFVVSSIPFALRLFLGGTSVQIQAGPDTVPKNVEIVQTGESTVLVTWQTNAMVVGSVRYGFSLTNAKMSVSNGAAPNKYHKVELKHIESEKEYELEILSETYIYHKDGAPLIFKLEPL